MAHQNPPPDRVVGLFGARGSGKSHTMRAVLQRERPRRLLMVDPLDRDYKGDAERVDTLAAMVRSSRGAAFALRYVPPDLQACTPDELAARFAAFCDIAWARGRLVMVVEEAQLFTRASSAPPAWANCTLRGRHREIQIFALTQRPAHIDKDFFSNATALRTGRLNFEDDLAVMARSLRVPRAAVYRLMGREWIARDLLTGAVTCEPADAVDRIAAQAPASMARAQVGAAMQKKPARARRR